MQRSACADAREIAEKGAGTATIAPRQGQSFSASFLTIAAAALLAFAFDKLRPEPFALVSARGAIALTPLLAAAALAAGFRRRLYRLMTSIPFAVSLVTVILAGTALGTFLVQNAPAADLTKHYGHVPAVVLRALDLDDVFTSFWFGGLLVLLAASLLLVVWKRAPLRWSQAGFVLAHLGIVVLLAGGLAGRIAGQRGMVHLNEGESGRTEKLGFDIRLDRFEVEHYKGEHKIYAYRARHAHREGESAYEPAATFKVSDGGRSHRVPGTDVRFRIVQADLNPPAGDAPHILVIEPSGRELAVRVGETVDIGDGWRVEIRRFLPHFRYDILTKQATSASDEPRNPALEVCLINGTTSALQWLFARMPDYSELHEKDRGGAPRLVYRYGRLPSVTLAIEEAGETETVRLEEDPENPVMLEDGTVLALGKRDDEVKSYRSAISIVRDGAVVRQGTVEVNAPLEYEGYLIYQSNSDPERPTYSGLTVIRDPGMPLVYAGFAMLCLGVVWIIYVRPRILSRKSRGEAAA